MKILEPPCSIFPDDPGPFLRERVRVLTVTSERIVVQLVRTESDSTPEIWSLLTSRVPNQWKVGMVGTIGYTPLELEWLKGLRELAK